jgi:hypothetical protein
MLTDELKGKLLAIAKTIATEHGWPWIEPVTINIEKGVAPQRIFSVITNMHAVGCNIRMSIRESDFAVIEAVFLPR